MRKMKIVLIRHGETMANKMNEQQNITLYTGALDNEYTQLTEKGRKQAELLRNLPIIQEITQVYCSDITRAIDTAKLAKPDYPLHIRKELRERSLGEFEGKTEQEIRENPELKKYLEDPQYKGFRTHFAKKTPGGENYTEVRERARQFLSSLNPNEEETIGIFAHLHIIRCLLLQLLTIEPQERIISFTLKNAEPYVLEGKDINHLTLISHSLEELEKNKKSNKEK